METPNPTTQQLPSTQTGHLYKPIFHLIKLSSDEKLNHLKKINSRTITKFNIDNFLTPSTYYQQPHNLQNLRKMANILQHEKTISTLTYIIRSSKPFGMEFAISKLKNNHHITHLNLELPFRNFCTPSRLQFLFKTLKHFKSLSSLTITFPVQITMTPQLFSSLFSALSCLPFLQNLTLNFVALKSLNHPVFSKGLSKLVKLKSLILNFEHAFQIHHSILISLASVFQKLTLLNTVDLNLFGTKKLQNSHLQSFFTSLMLLKSLKHFYLNLEYCELDDLNSDPLSQGLLLLQSAQLQSLSLFYYSESQDNASEGLALALQNFPSLQHLCLDFSHDSQISDTTLSKLALSTQQLHYLSILQLNIPSGIHVTSPAEILATAIKPLLNLTSLNLKFAWRPHMGNEQFILFSESLAGLTRLTQLTLILYGLWDESDQILSENKADERLAALGKSLKSLVNLKSLHFEFSDMRTLSDKGMIEFCAGLVRLKKLSCLHLDFHGNQELNRDGMIILGAALKRTRFLNSIYLNFLGCSGTKDKLGFIYKDLTQLKLVETLTVKALFSNADMAAAIQNLKHIPKRDILWG